MKNCRHFILSCGGFARLASDLCDNPDKIVIRPDMTCKADWDIFNCRGFNHRMLRKKIYAAYLVRKWYNLKRSKNQ
jgi:hypothetical protein